MGISKKSWTGLAIESPAGTAAATPTVYHPCKTKAQQKKKYVYLTEDRGARDANTKRKVSVRSSTVDVNGTFYLDTSPYLLYAFMGGLATTQPDATNAPTGYAHDLTLADNPPALTVFKGYDIAGYYFAYGAVAKYKLKFAADGKLLEEEASLENRYGMPIAGGSFSAMTPTYSDDTLAGEGTIFSGYMPTLKFNTVAATNIETMDVELEQKLTLYYAINGSQDQVKVYYGDRSAKISFDASFDDTSLYTRYDQDLDDHISIEFLGRTIGTGPSTVKERLYLDFPIVGYDDMEMDTSKEYIQIKAKATARPGVTLNSMMTAQVVNSVATY